EEKEEEEEKKEKKRGRGRGRKKAQIDISPSKNSDGKVKKNTKDLKEAKKIKTKLVVRKSKSKSKLEKFNITNIYKSAIFGFDEEMESHIKSWFNLLTNEDAEKILKIVLRECVILLERVFHSDNELFQHSPISQDEEKKLSIIVESIFRNDKNILVSFIKKNPLLPLDSNDLFVFDLLQPIVYSSI
ncbi:hypothetical protein ADUPG1_004876, partial [Aduncisulcus paluster]